MITGGEILRAIATKNTLGRRFKVHSAFVDIDPTLAVGRQFTTVARFVGGKLFLWTGTVISGFTRAATAAPPVNVVVNQGLTTVLLPDGSRRNTVPGNTTSFTASEGNRYTDNTEYVLFEGDERVQFTFTQNYTATVNRRVTVCMMGIEYDPKG